MTERQRLITKYITGLEPKMKVAYEKRVLSYEKDPAAIQMLKNDIKTLDDSKESSHETHSLFGEEYYKNYKVDLREKNLDFELSKKEFLDYTDQLIMNGDFMDALFIASKSKNIERIFLMSIANGKIDAALKYIEFMEKRISTLKNDIITPYELIFIILVLNLATEPIKVFQEVQQRIAGFDISQDYPALFSIVDSICRYDYGDAVFQLDQFYYLLKQSLYTGPSADIIIAMIRDNIVSMIVNRYAKVSLEKLEKMTNLSKKDLIISIKSGLRSGKIIGKLNTQDGIFSAQGVREQRQQREILAKIEIITEEIEKSQRVK